MLLCGSVCAEGVSHEVENLIQENTELLATKLVAVCFSSLSHCCVTICSR